MVAAETLTKFPGNFQGRRVHIVIAEDNAVTRRLIELAVTRLGWTFESARDGLEALSVVERAEPDLALVLADISMPRMTGIELTRTIKHMPSLADLLVVLMSSPEREPEAREAGCDAFLAKPFSVADLLEVLNP